LTVIAYYYETLSLVTLPKNVKSRIYSQNVFHCKLTVF